MVDAYSLVIWCLVDLTTLESVEERGEMPIDFINTKYGHMQQFLAVYDTLWNVIQWKKWVIVPNQVFPRDLTIGCNLELL